MQLRAAGYSMVKYRRNADGEVETDGEEDLPPKPLTYAEQVSELLYAGKTMAEVAGYTTWQRTCVLFLKRDKHGRLVREDPNLPPHVKVDDEGMRVIGRRTTLDAAYRKAMKAKGLPDDKIKAGWQQFQDDNPKMGNSGRLTR